jgi:uncharacterized membrane protein YdjX (TVP38/TMEM64 family)
MKNQLSGLGIMKSNKKILAFFAVTALFVLAALTWFFNSNLPSQVELQLLMESYGYWGIFLYLFFATASVTITPLNFSLFGMAGGFVYGTWTAFFLNWFAKVVGTSLAFWIARKLGNQVLPFFTKRDIKDVRRMLNSEKLVLAYFALCFIPFTPSDNIAYLLGFSNMKARHFIPITIVANSGTAFTLAYIGSGEALDNLLFLIVLGFALIIGLSWLHKNKDTFELQ